MLAFKHIALVGAALLVIYSREANSFTLDRNLVLMDIDDSLETSTTMDLSGSIESIPSNTSKEDDIDSSEDDHLTDGDSVLLVASVNSTVSHLVIPTVTQKAVGQLNVHVRDQLSRDQLAEDLARTDDPINIQSTSQVVHVNADHDDSLEDVLEKLAAQPNVEISTSAETASIESTIPDDDDSLEDMKIVQMQTSPASKVPSAASVSLVVQDDDDDDISWEDYDLFVNPGALQLMTTDFHHLPATLFTHPTSEDWFLTRHYMDDHFVWALGDELVKEYFWQPVKANSKLNLGSPVQVSAGNVAQVIPA